MNIYVSCPHCYQMVEIIEINCKIFRHGVYKTTQKQIDPHLNKEECDRLFYNNEIYGCGQPFRLIQSNSNFTTEICGYI